MILDIKKIRHKTALSINMQFNLREVNRKYMSRIASINLKNTNYAYCVREDLE